MLRPLDTVVAFNIFAIVVYTAVIVYRFRLVTYSLGHELQLPVARAEIEALDERTLPVYTILVPLYREPELVADLIDRSRSSTTRRRSSTSSSCSRPTTRRRRRRPERSTPLPTSRS